MDVAQPGPAGTEAATAAGRAPSPSCAPASLTTRPPPRPGVSAMAWRRSGASSSPWRARPHPVIRLPASTPQAPALSVGFTDRLSMAPAAGLGMSAHSAPPRRRRTRNPSVPAFHAPFPRGRPAEQIEVMEQTRAMQGRMLRAAARRPLSREALAERLRDGCVRRRPLHVLVRPSSNAAERPGPGRPVNRLFFRTDRRSRRCSASMPSCRSRRGRAGRDPARWPQTSEGPRLLCYVIT
jgi:hypothetical protein